MDLLLPLLMLLMSLPISGNLRIKCPLSLEHQEGEKPWSYYRPGDHLISIVITATEISHMILLFNKAPYNQSDFLPYDKSRIVHFIFNIQVVNKTPQLLHNLTLGYNIHDNYLNTLGTSDALLDILSTGEANVPNYSCGRKDNLLTLVDGAERDISIQMSTLVGLYKVSQISLEIASEALSEKSQFPFFHQTFLKEGFQYPGIVQLLLHYRWRLIGLFASDTEKGENFLRTFTPLLVRSEICVVVSQQFSTTTPTKSFREAMSKWRQVNVFVHFAEYDPIFDRILPFHLTLEGLPGPTEGKVWIMTGLGVYEIKKHRLLKYIHSIWNYSFRSNKRPKDDAFEPYFFLNPQFEDQSFECLLSKHVFSVKGRRQCTQKSPLGTQKKGSRLQISNDEHYYSFIKTLAHALNAAYSSHSRRKRKEGDKSLGTPRLQPWQVAYVPFENTKEKEENLLNVLALKKVK